MANNFFLNFILKKDQHGNKLEYIVPHKGNNLGRIFGIMESNKDSFLIADYSVSQTTLDQVFINFAKTQRGKFSDEEDEEGEENEEENGDINNDDEKRYYNHHTELNSTITTDVNQNMNTTNNQITVSIPPVNDDLNNDTPTFESIKNHFNSFKKKGHIRKTSSAKSMQPKQSIRSKKSEMSRSSSKRRIENNSEMNGFNNLAYEIEFKNREQYPPYQYDLSLQDSHDLTASLNEDGEYFSRC